MAKDVLVVKIYNQEYKIKIGDNDPDYIQKLAGQVDSKIQEFADHFKDMDYQRLLVLVCLNITDELEKLKERCTETEGVSKMLLDLKSLLTE